MEKEIESEFNRLKELFDKQFESSPDKTEFLQQEVKKNHDALYGLNPEPGQETLAHRLGRFYFYERKYFREVLLLGELIDLPIQFDKDRDRRQMHIKVHAHYNFLKHLEDKLHYGETFLQSLDEIVGFDFYRNALGINTNPLTVEGANTSIKKYGRDYTAKSYHNAYRYFEKHRNKLGDKFKEDKKLKEENKPKKEKKLKKGTVSERHNIINELNRLGYDSSIAVADLEKLMTQIEKGN